MNTIMDITFEVLTEQHRKDVIDILNFYILSTTAAFRDITVEYKHFDNFIDKDSVYRGYAIKNKTGTTIGFCILEPFKNIVPFKKTAEATYFIKKEYVGNGIGSRMIEKLENDAKVLGISKIVVDITDDNDVSIKFHKKNGFKEYGRLNKCWKKFEKDLGIVYMEKDI